MGQRRTAGDVRPHGDSQQGIRQGGGKADGNEPEHKPGPGPDQVEEEQEAEHRHMHGVEKKHWNISSRASVFGSGTPQGARSAG